MAQSSNPRPQQRVANPQGQTYQQPPQHDYQGPPPQGYYQQPPPPATYQQAPPPGYYYQQPPPQGYYQQPPPQGYYYQQPPPTIIIVDDTDAPYRRGRRLDDSTDSTDQFSSSFSNKKIRAAFIRRVYTLLTLMLVVVSAMCALFMFVPPLKEFMHKYWWLVFIATFIYIGLVITLVCFQDIRRKSPLNIILLAIFTFISGFILAFLTSYYDVLTVLMALGTTVGLCLLITLFACQTKVDITGWGAYLSIILLSFFIFSLIAFIIQLLIRSTILQLVIAGIGTALFSV
ncbi:hypothetical protein L9F63_011461, partial [Diploptera punctata]